METGGGIAHPVRREFLNFGQAGKVAFITSEAGGGTLREGSFVRGPQPGQQFGQVPAQLDTRELTANVVMLQAELEQARYSCPRIKVHMFGRHDVPENREKSFINLCNLTLGSEYNVMMKGSLATKRHEKAQKRANFACRRFFL